MLLGHLENTLVFLKKGFDRSLCIFKFQLLSFSLGLYPHDIYKQIESLQKRAPRLLYNDYTASN